MPNLEVRSIVMQFPAVLALDDVSLRFVKGEVHGVIGENGAGKSTLMRILSGIQRQTLGEIAMGEDECVRVEISSVRDAIRHGISMIHQELNLVDTLTVAENVFLGREPVRRGALDRRRMNSVTARYLGQVGAQFPPDVLVGDLSLAGKQLVEIAKALSYEASILIMDEPTSVLSDQETANLFALIERLKERGVTVLYISHRLAEVERICDRITVLRDGKVVATCGRGEIGQAEMASLMVGRALGDVYPSKTPRPSAPPLLTIRDLSDGERLFGASLDVAPGEIVGLAGLVGAGRTELGELLAGLRHRRSGTVHVAGVRVLAGSPREAAKHGIAYVSEDRKDAGLVLAMDVVENTTLANLAAYSGLTIRKDQELSSAARWRDRLDIRVGDMRAPVMYLSGGNQQKVAVAKWLDTNPKVLILDEPTRGVDVGAKRELYELVHKLATEGMACLVISSEMPELIGLCHRILVMRGGRIVGEVEGGEMSEEAIMVLAAGVEAA